MEIENAYSALKSGLNCVLFLGAGFSRGAKTISGCPVPNAFELAGKLDPEENRPELQSSVEVSIEERGRQETFDVLKENLITSSIDPRLKEILSLNWARIYTTNIDDILYKNFPSAVYVNGFENSVEIGNARGVYLHGCIMECSEANFDSNLRLATSTYIEDGFISGVAKTALQKELKEADCVVVIGYGMSDPDLASLFRATPDIINKCVICSGVATRQEAIKFRLLGSDSKLTSYDFLSGLNDYEVVPKFKIPKKFGRELEFLPSTGEVTQIALRDLWLKGIVKDSLAVLSWKRSKRDVVGRPYIFIRNHINIKAVDFGSTVLLHSYFGRGKSIYLRQIAWDLSERGLHVFELNPYLTDDEVVEALEIVPVNSVCVFDATTPMSETISRQIHERGLIFLSALRTTTYYSRMAQIKEIYPSALVANLNNLKSSEIDEVYKTINLMGYWPEELPRHEEGRLHFLKNLCDSSLSDIQLSIFESEKVASQLADLWGNTEFVGDLKQQIVINSYLSLIDVEVPPWVILDYQNTTKSITYQEANALVDVQYDGCAKFRTSVLSQYAAKHFFTQNEVSGAITSFVNYLCSRSDYGRYSSVPRRVLRYWNLRKFLPNDEEIFKVFDGSSFIPDMSRDPLFWISYSIAAIEVGDFISGSRYLARSYEEAAKRRDYDTYQIDTHAAFFEIRNFQATENFFSNAEKFISRFAVLKDVIAKRHDDVHTVAKSVNLLVAEFTSVQSCLTPSQVKKLRLVVSALRDQYHSIVTRYSEAHLSPRGLQALSGLRMILSE